MNWQFSIFAAPLYGTAILTAVAAFKAWRQRQVPGSILFSALMGIISLRILSYALQLSAADLPGKLIWSNVEITVGAFMPALWLLFSLEYSLRKPWLRTNKIKSLLLWVFPALVAALIWSDSGNQIARKTVTVLGDSTATVLHTEFTAVFLLTSSILLLYALIGILLMARAAFVGPAIYRKQAVTLLSISLLPLASTFFINIGFLPQLNIHLAPYILTLSGGIMYWALYQYRLLTIVPAIRTTVVQRLHNGIYILDPMNYLVDVNDVGEKWLSPGKPVIGLPARKVFAEWPAILAILENRQEIYTELPHDALVPGFAFSVELTRLENKSGNLMGRVLILQDISSRSQSDAALREAKTSAEAAAQAKSAFLANMSHEIRTPLNAVVGMAELLRDTNLTSEQRELVETIYSSSDTLLAIINNILDFSKIEAGKVVLEEAPFDLVDCLQVSTNLAGANANLESVKLSFQIAPESPPTIMGDAVRLRQILVNLLSNAVKFTQEGEVVTAVSSQQLSGNQYQLQFSVKDTGIGIPKEQIEKIFHSFNQADSSTTRKYGGTGLGLAISKNLVELMGGRMWAESIYGQGSTFHFTILTTAADAPSARRLTDEQPRLHGKRLLILAKSADIRRQFSRETRNWGMSPYVAGSNQEALYWIRRSEPFDLAVLDHELINELDNDFIAAIQGMRDGGTIPLLLLSDLEPAQLPEIQVPVTARISPNTPPSKLNDILSQIFITADHLTSPKDSDKAGTAVAAPQIGIDSETPMGMRHPLHILLAEDNRVNQKVAVRILQKLGYMPDVANNGREAITMLEVHQYDVILMDIQMPEMDGVAATQHIRQHWLAEKQPHIIAMTAHALAGDREYYLANGMDDYVSKPIQIEKLVSALYQVKPKPDQMIEISNSLSDNGGHIDPQSPEIGSPSVDPNGIIDMEFLTELLGPEAGEMLPQLLPLYLEDGEKLILMLQTAVDEKDGSTIRQAAHTLKGSSASLGIKQLAALSKQLEIAGETGTYSEAEQLFAEIKKGFTRVAALVNPEALQ